MSLIVSQTGVSRLPAELVNNAAFVKRVDFDPLHQTVETDQPAEKINRPANRFDRITISAEALAKVKDIQRLPAAAELDARSPDIGADSAGPAQQRPEVIDITDPASVARRKQGNAMGRAMSSWNAAVEQMKQISESSRSYGYSETIKLFKNGYADWKSALRKSDPEAYGAWLRMLGEDR